MEIYSKRALAQKVSVEDRFYSRVARWVRGERGCLTKSEITAIGKVLDAEYKTAKAALKECVPAKD